MTTSRPARVWAEVTGGDARGRGHQPALSWWLPQGSSVQHAYQVRPIEVSWQLREGAFELDVLVPPGTTARVVLPGEAPRQAHPGRHQWTSVGIS